jgi:hypothetical protein
MNDGFKNVLFAVFGGLILHFLIGEKADKAVSKALTKNGVVTGGGGGAGGAGGAGGSGIGSGGGIGDVTALAAAIQALANGVAMPPIRSVSVANAAAGSTQLIAGISGKRICVLGYAITSAGTCNANFRSTLASSPVWEIDLDSASGKSGANLVTAWPSYIFTAEGNDGLTVELTNNATVSISYFLENT